MSLFLFGGKKLGVFLLELFQASRLDHASLFTRVKRMTRGAHGYAEFSLGRSRIEAIAARTTHRAGLILGVDILLHVLHLQPLSDRFHRRGL